MRTAVLVAVMLLGFGCANLETSVAGKIGGEAAFMAARVGTAREIRKNPEAKPAFVAAEAALTRMLDGGSGDPAQFASIVSTLPVDALKGPDGAVYVDGIVFAFDLLSNTAFGGESAAGVKFLAGKVRDGIRAGLAATTATPAASVRGGAAGAAPSYVIRPAKVIRL